MIAIVYPQFYGVGGIARYLDSFLKNLPENHPMIYVITGDEHRAARDYDNVTLVHIPFTSNRFNLLCWTLKAQAVLNRLFKEGKIHVYNLHIPPLITGLLLSKRIPMVLTAHTTYLGMSGRFYKAPLFKSQWNFLEIACKRWIEQRIFNKAQSIITLTAQGAQELLQYDVRAPIAVIPNGVDSSVFNITGSHQKTIDVLFCGRIEQRKGSRAMVALCLALMARQPGMQICIVGYGDDDVWVKAQLLRFSPNITITGKVPFSEMKAYYEKSKVYVSTSYYEGLPGTCLEAMAMGLPAVTWDLPFYHGLVVTNKTGTLIPPNDIPMMVNAVMSTLEKVQTNGEEFFKTRQHVQQLYDWRGLSAQILAVLGQQGGASNK